MIPATLPVAKRTVTGKIPFEVGFYTLPNYEWAVGTINAVNETAVGSKILAKVVEVNIKAGQRVRQGDVLAKLDDRVLWPRAAQAKAAVTAADANKNQAQADYNRIMRLARSDAASEHEINPARNQLQAAIAGLDRAKDTLSEGETSLTYATIRAPFDGTIIDKAVDAGDVVTAACLGVSTHSHSLKCRGS